MSEGIRYFHLPEWEGVELCVGDDVTAPLPPQFHDWLEVRLILRGSAKISIGRSQYLVLRGSLMVIRPGEFSAIDVGQQERVSFLSICADPALLRNSAHGSPSTEIAVEARSALFVDPVLRELLLGARRVMIEGATSSKRHALRRELIAELTRCGLGIGLSRVPGDLDGEHPPSIQRAMAFMREHWAREVSLAELSTEAGLSKFHFLRLFSEHLGVTPHRYQLLLRVARARALLRSGAEIADAAFYAGFYDQSHLTRCFHSVVGVPPRRFQRFGF